MDGNTVGLQQIVVATFFGAWVTYQAQSLISIDNVGIAIWGWVLGGIVVALSREGVVDETALPRSVKEAKRKRKTFARESSSLAQPMISGLLFVVALALCIPMFLSDSSLRTLRMYAAPNSSEVQAYQKVARKPLGYGFQDPHAKITIATLLAQAGLLPEAKADLVAVLSSDPRSYDALATLATIEEQTKNSKAAIPYRQRIAALDPWNYQNLLKLGEDLKVAGDTAGAKAMMAKIDAFASKTPEAVTAHKDFGSL